MPFPFYQLPSLGQPQSATRQAQQQAQAEGVTVHTLRHHHKLLSTDTQQLGESRAMGTC